MEPAIVFMLGLIIFGLIVLMVFAFIPNQKQFSHKHA
jgi:hypothetical protein